MTTVVFSANYNSKTFRSRSYSSLLAHQHYAARPQHNKVFPHGRAFHRGISAQERLARWWVITVCHFNCNNRACDHTSSCFAWELAVLALRMILLLFLFGWCEQDPKTVLCECWLILESRKGLSKFDYCISKIFRCWFSSLFSFTQFFYCT